MIGNLSSHLKFSAQFCAIDEVDAKFERIFDHAEALSKELQIAAAVLDSLSNETHVVSIARAFMVYSPLTVTFVPR